MSENRVSAAGCDSKETHYGLCVLRMIMCFQVVLCHFGNQDSQNITMRILNAFNGVAVPIFMLMAFYLTADKFFSRSTVWTRRRLSRLLFPQVIWGVIYFVTYTIVDALIVNNMSGGGYCFSDLIYQISFGHSSKLNPSMWFQFAIVVITGLVSILIYMIRKDEAVVIILNILMLISIGFQYTGILEVFLSSTIYEVKYPLGRLCEVFPYAVLGIDLHLLNKFFGRNLSIKIRKSVIICIESVVAVLLLVGMTLPGPMANFGYGGLKLAMVTIAVFGFFNLFSLTEVPATLKNAIRFFTKYTLGIYCIHRLIIHMINSLNIKFQFSFNFEPGFCSSLCVYIVSFVVCALISRLPFDWCKKLVE